MCWGEPGKVGRGDLPPTPEGRRDLPPVPEGICSQPQRAEGFYPQPQRAEGIWSQPQRAEGICPQLQRRFAPSPKGQKGFTPSSREDFPPAPESRRDLPPAPEGCKGQRLNWAQQHTQNMAAHTAHSSCSVNSHLFARGLGTAWREGHSWGSNRSTPRNIPSCGCCYYCYSVSRKELNHHSL